jgi:ABC-2 type transport system permease protein
MKVWNAKFALLLRRELWEHRAVWAGPLVVVGIVLLMSMFGPGRLGAGGQTGLQAPTEMALLFGRGVMIVLTTVLGGVTCIALFAYLLDCLYAERKDRSILFWKSLPVSDAQTVLAKVVLALVIAPLLALLIAAVVFPVLLGALRLRFDSLDGVIGWDAFVGAYGMLPRIALTWLCGVLWYAPFAGYLLLASVLAKRVPLMYAVMPPAVLMLLEGTVLNSFHIGRFLAMRLAPWTGDYWSLNITPEQLMSGTADPDWTGPLLDINLWLGVAVAAGMVYIVIRLRRYRDDT